MSIKKLDDGRYEVDVRPQGADGKRIRRKFKTKGEEVINNNISAIKEALKSINMFDGNLTYENSIINDKSDIFEINNAFLFLVTKKNFINDVKPS